MVTKKLPRFHNKILHSKKKVNNNNNNKKHFFQSSTYENEVFGGQNDGFWAWNCSHSHLALARWPGPSQVARTKKKNRGVQHKDFPGGHPSKYYSRPSTLSYGVQMGSGALMLVWTHPLGSLRKKQIWLTLLGELAPIVMESGARTCPRVAPVPPKR